MPSLFVIKGDDQGKLFDLEEGTLGIGRDPSNHLQVHDTEVSRRHAELRYDGTRCMVADLGSSNGTYVNGAKHRGRAAAGQRRQGAGRRHADAVHRP